MTDSNTVGMLIVAAGMLFKACRCFMSLITCVAFDCFGTVFDMSGVSREEIKAYVSHVRKNDFTPFLFPPSWWELKLHPDSAAGIARLQAKGFCASRCLTGL